jgi:sugar lactone lactonase YvrE
MRGFRRIHVVAISAALLVTPLVSVISTGTPASADSNRNNRPERIDLPNGWRPEGITAGRGTSLFVGSLETGAIWKTDTRTGVGAIFSPGAPGRVGVGIDFDKRNNRLWSAGGPSGEVRVVDADSGVLLQTYVAPPLANQFLNDVAVAKDAVYVTDSNNQRLIVIPLPKNGDLPPASAATVLPLLGATGTRGNGIVASEGWLIIVQSGIGALFRVDPSTGATTRIDLGSYLVTNGDGLELHDDDELFVVRNRNNLVAQIELDDDLLSGELKREITAPLGDLDVPTTAALQNGRLWAVNARFGTTAPLAPNVAPYWITQLDPED